MGRVTENQQTFYVCGRCRSKILYLKTDEATVPCPECSWEGLAKKPTDIPSEIKMEIN